MAGRYEAALHEMLRTDRSRSALLRGALVNMLFALAVQRTAMQAQRWFDATHPSLDVFTQLKWDELAPFMHIALACLLIIVSWVGWSRSHAPGNMRPLTGVFGKPFIVLGLDVVLVSVYFVVVAKAELLDVLVEEHVGGVNRHVSRCIVGPPSAEPEARWLMLVFLLYAIWDLVADVWMRKRGDRLRQTIVRPVASLVCFVLAFSVYRTAALGETGRTVVMTDLALMAIVILFRALKPYERIIAELVGIGLTGDKSQSRVAYSPRMTLCILVSALVFLATFGMACQSRYPIHYGWPCSMLMAFCAATIGMAVIHAARFPRHAVARIIEVRRDPNAAPLRLAGIVRQSLKRLPAHQFRRVGPKLFHVTATQAADAHDARPAWWLEVSCVVESDGKGWTITMVEKGEYAHFWDRICQRFWHGHSEHIEQCLNRIARELAEPAWQDECELPEGMIAQRMLPPSGKATVVVS